MNPYTFHHKTHPIPTPKPHPYNMERPYVGGTLSSKLAWPHVLQQNLSKTMENVMISLFGPTRRCEERSEEVQNV
jgi:hypothetical protein